MEQTSHAPQQERLSVKNRENNWGRGPLFFYVPDEIHVLLDAPQPDGDWDVALGERHDILWKALNNRLSQMAKDKRFNSDAIERRIEERMAALPALARGEQRDGQTSGQVDGPRASEPSGPSRLGPALMTALVNDLKPDDETLQALEDGTHPLQPLVPLFPPDRVIPQKSWVVLPGVPDDQGEANKEDALLTDGRNGGEDRLRSLHFFQVGSHRLQTAARVVMDAAILNEGVALSKEAAIAKVQEDADTRARYVRDLVKIINLHPDMLHDDADMRVLLPDHSVAAVPNWLCDATCGGCSCPGSPPQPIPPERLRDQDGFWSFEFSKNNRLKELVEEQRKSGDTSNVIVAVLDTSPTIEEMKTAAAKGDFARNMLLQHVNGAAQAMASKGERPRQFGSITIDSTDDGSLPREAFDHLEGITIDWRQKGEPSICHTTGDTYKMNDHGLFITGIVHDIAPRADLHLIRVLGEYGVAHTGLILPVLQGLPDHLLKNNQKRLIINMSLGWSIPPGGELLRTWLESTFCVLKPLLAEHGDLDAAFMALQKGGQEGIARTIKAIIDHLHAPIREMIAFLTNNEKEEYKNRILIVAAAGNDNHWFERPPNDAVRHRPEPRWPARYPEVIGVAAVGFADENAYYSNRADIESQSNGVATFGGNAVRKGEEYLGEIETYSGLTGASGGLTGIEADKKVDAVRGIYITDPVMLDAGDNKTGWVYWSGTSFATPVIAGLAADFWASYPDASPEQIITVFTGGPEGDGPFDTVPRNRTNADTLDCPKIFAEQVWKTATLGASLHAVDIGNNGE